MTCFHHPDPPIPSTLFLCLQRCPIAAALLDTSCTTANLASQIAMRDLQMKENPMPEQASKFTKPPAVSDVHILWITAGLELRWRQRFRHRRRAAQY